MCVSVQTYSCWRWFVGTLASNRFPKRICSTTIGCLFDDVRWIDFRVVRAETSKRHRNTHELTEPKYVLARNLYVCEQLRSCMLLSGRDAQQLGRRLGDAASLDALPPHTWGMGTVSNLILQLRSMRIWQKGANKNKNVQFFLFFRRAFWPLR